ncbi:MAG: adenylyltransferase/cytidyltransferase family protein [Parcubacteria group bacterium]|nr:adenylyltransferase/cytidyltransferase family protein [Parcubacteria group bacterium]
MAPTVKTILEAGFKLENKYIPDYNDLGHLVDLLKTSGYTIVLTQGVWDMYHVGHSRYLIRARAFGDVLIVGVDSNELTRQMKGSGRPFDNFDERTELLAGFSFINILTRRDVGQHKYELIKLVRPDVLVMSKTTKSFTERDKKALGKHCGRIEYLEAQAPPTSVSTTAKIRRLQLEGAEELAGRISKAIELEVISYLGKDGASG